MHKSGKKEKISPFQPFTTHSLYHEYFTMPNAHMKQQGVLLDLDQEISGRAASQNRSKNYKALTVEIYMYDTAK